MEKITTGTVSIGADDINNVVDAMKSGMLSTGKYLHEFERTFPGFYGKDFGVMVNSGQSALEVAFKYVLDQNPKIDLWVAVPSLTYMATIWAAIHDRVSISFFDIKLEDYGIDFNSIGFTQFGEPIESDNIDIILPVDLFGKTCNVRKSRPNQTIIEDACEAVGNANCSYGDFICFSFYASHIMSVGGAGIVIFKDEEADRFIRSYIAHGRSHSGDFTQYSEEFMDRFIFERFGQSLRSDNIHAAIAVSQYKKVYSLIGARISNAKRMNDNLSGLTSIAKLPDTSNNVFQFYPLLVDKSDYNALHLMEFLFRNNIDSRRFMPVITQPAFINQFPEIEPEMFPNSLLCGEKGVLLGCHQNLTYDQIDFMCEKVIEFFKIRREV